MKLGVFVNTYKCTSEVLAKMTADKLGIILVQNGIYYATLKEGGKPADVLNLKADFYVLGEDLKARGFTEADINSKVKVIDYNGLVDLIFNTYEKFAWI